MAKNRKLSVAQRFKRRNLANERKTKALQNGSFYEHDNRSPCLLNTEHEELKMTSTVVSLKKSHKKIRSREYWNRIKSIKKQQLAMQRIIVGAVCNQNSQTRCCCCHCACPSSFHKLKRKVLTKNVESVVKNVKINYGTSNINVHNLKVGEFNRENMQSILRYLSLPKVKIMTIIKTKRLDESKLTPIKLLLYNGLFFYSVRETHEIAKAQQDKNAKLREAFGISEYFVEGTSFDPQRQAKEELAKSEAMQKKLAKDVQEKIAENKKYTLVRTPSPDLSSKSKDLDTDDEKSKSKRSKKSKKEKKKKRKREL